MMSDLKDISRFFLLKLKAIKKMNRAVKPKPQNAELYRVEMMLDVKILESSCRVTIVTIR